MGLPYGNHIPQPDGEFFTACRIGSFRNGYIGVFRFDGRCFCRTADGRVQLIHIDGIGSGRTGCHVGNLLIVRVETIFIDIGLSVDGQAAIRPKIHIFFQLHIELCSIRYDANISICQVCRSAAFDFQLVSQLFINIRAGVSAEVQPFSNCRIDVCNIIGILCDICLIGLHAVADCFQLVFRGGLPRYGLRVVNIPSRICKAVYSSGIPIHRDGMGLPYGNHIPQPDSEFLAAIPVSSFRNSYISVFCFDCCMFPCQCLYVI